MKITAIAFTREGAKRLEALRAKLGARCFAAKKYAGGDIAAFESLGELTGEQFKTADALVFVGACGIAVRAIAPYVNSKATDPAVVVMDERAKFVIPLLSGHIGGANALSRKIAKLTGACAVITTATDINNKFSVDTFACDNNLYIGDTKLIKEISSRALDGERIGLVSDYPLKNKPDIFTDNADAGIYIGHKDKKPFAITLTLIPRDIVLGIGCKKNCPDVPESILGFLKANSVNPRGLCAAATIDIKRDERGIVDFCERYGIPLLTYGAQELSCVEGEFTASEFVKKTVGVDNVCERAVCAAGASLTVRKTVCGKTTLALGRRDITIDFGRNGE